MTAALALPAQTAWLPLSVWLLEASCPGDTAQARRDELRRQERDRNPPPTVAVYRPTGPGVLPPGAAKAIDEATRVVGRRFRMKDYERDDLRQELALVLLESKERPDILRAWLITTGKRLMIDAREQKKRQRAILKHWSGLGPIAPGLRPYNGESIPDDLVWYVATTRHEHGRWGNKLEDAMIAMVDDRAARGIGPKRTPTCRQNQIAEHAIRCKRTSSYNSTPVQATIVPEGRVEPSSPLKGKAI